MFLFLAVQFISGSSFCVSGSAGAVRCSLRSTCPRTWGIDILWRTNMKHQSISRWLSQLGLPQYCLVLEQEYDGVEVNIWIYISPLFTFITRFYQLVEPEKHNANHSTTRLKLPQGSCFADETVMWEVFQCPAMSSIQTDVLLCTRRLKLIKHNVLTIDYFLTLFPFRNQKSAALVCCTAAVSLMPVNNCCYGDNAIQKAWSEPSLAITHAWRSWLTGKNLLSQ